MTNYASIICQYVA